MQDYLMIKQKQGFDVILFFPTTLVARRCNSSTENFANHNLSVAQTKTKQNHLPENTSSLTHRNNRARSAQRSAKPFFGDFLGA